MGILGQIENNVEVTEDKNPIETNSGDISKGPVNNDRPKDDKKEKVIVMDGPLSTIYTKALNLVFSNNGENQVAIETQQMDSVLVADAHEFSKKKEKLKQEDMDKASYVYVTDSETVERQPAQSFDELRIALDMDTSCEKIICIECLSGAHLERINTIINYVEQHPSAPKVFFTRHATISYLSR